MDSGNRAGGVERHLDARLTPAGPLGLSSLVLTDPAVRVDGKMKLVVDGRVSGPSVAAYVEMQRLQPAADAAAAAARPVVQFEVAKSDDGPALAGSVPARRATNPALAPGSPRARSTWRRWRRAPTSCGALVLWNGAVVGRASRSIIVERRAPVTDVDRAFRPVGHAGSEARPTHKKAPHAAMACGADSDGTPGLKPRGPGESG